MTLEELYKRIDLQPEMREKLCIIVQIVAQVQHIYNFLFIRPSNA